MSVSLARLRALTREAGGAVPAIARRGDGAAVALPVAAMASRPDMHEDAPPPLAQARRVPLAGVPGAAQTIDSLRRLLGVRGRVVLAPGTAAPPSGSVDRSLPGAEIAPGLRLVESWQPVAAPPAAWPLAFAKREDTVDPRAVMFFDTETTGLAGGTGTRAFMVGAAELHHDAVHGDRLRIRQLLITTMAAERAMLEVFASWLRPTTVLSSYNGRCYDAPLLKTRYRLARMADPLSALDHVDLLFPSRRRWRGRWENCRLATIEREALGIAREDDLPGSEAPAAWLRYLRGGSSSLLKRVAAHNHQDVVTLALLMARLVALHDDDAAAASAIASRAVSPIAPLVPATLR